MAEPIAPYIGNPMLRREDRRLLTGQGQFVADLVLPRMLHAVFVRSPLAHARIRGSTCRAPRRRPAWCWRCPGADLRSCCRRCPRARSRCRANGRLSSSTNSSTRSSRCSRTTRSGMSARRSRSSSPRPATRPRTPPSWSGSIWRSCRQWSTRRRRCEPGAPIVHERYDTNLIGSFSVAKGDADAVLARAPHRLKRRFYHHRYAAVPMECRGVVAALRPRAPTR